MEEEKKEEKKELLNGIKEQIGERLKEISEQQVQQGNIDFLYKLIDIKKDIVEIEKEENSMMYRNYGEYGEGNYGRRGVPGSGRRYRESGYGYGTGRGSYRGEQIMDDMKASYQEYSEGKENYGADSATMESFEYMLKSFKDYFKHLKNEATSPEETEMLQKVAREIGNM